MRAAAVTLALALWMTGLASPLPVRAEAPTVGRAEVVWAGLYEAQVAGNLEQPDTASGRTNELMNTRKIKSTTTVDGRLGVSFGLEYVLAGSPVGASVPVTIVVVLPKEGLLNPAKGEPTYREQWRPSPKPIGARNIVGYTFEQPWEVVPGLWTFEIWSGEQKLGEQSFCVLTERPAEGGKGEPCRSVPSV